MINLLQAAETGIGVYSVSEAARYAGMPANTIRSWFFPSGQRNRIWRTEIASEERKLSFLDLVEAFAVRALRERGVASLQRIREAVEQAEKKYNVRHIFAREDHKTFVDNKGEFVIKLAGERDLIGLTGKGVDQALMSEFVADYMTRLSFGPDGLAKDYTAFNFRDQRIILDPAWQFGAPFVEENGYPVEVLWSGVRAVDGDIKRAAELYDASRNSVEAAVKYCADILRLVA